VKISQITATGENIPDYNYRRKYPRLQLQVKISQIIPTGENIPDYTYR